MARPFNPATWRLTLKVPVLVAVLIVAVAVAASNIVLMRLSETQNSNLRQLTGAYLDGLSTAVLPHVIRKDVWETFDILDRARERYEGLNVLYTVVALNDGFVLAASDPDAFPVDSAVPEDLMGRFPKGDKLVIDEGGGQAWASRTLSEGFINVGRIFTKIDIAVLLNERRNALVTLIVLNAILTLSFVAIGYLMARRMVRPVSVLSDYVERARKGKVELIPSERFPDRGTELGDLFSRFNALARAMSEREVLFTRLAEEEKLAQLGKLASGMAHEVNNPLGGMMNALDTLEKHGDDPNVRKTSLDLLKRGLTGIRNVVRAALVTYKGVSDPVSLNREDFDDIKFLIKHETSRRQLRLVWSNKLPHEVHVDSAATRQVVLNLILNACAVSPICGEVRVGACLNGGALHISITDQGPGLPETVAELFANPSVTASPTKSTKGLGAWTAARLVMQMNGRFDVISNPETGTQISVIIPLADEERIHAAA